MRFAPNSLGRCLLLTTLAVLAVVALAPPSSGQGPILTPADPSLAPQIAPTQFNAPRFLPTHAEPVSIPGLLIPEPDATVETSAPYVSPIDASNLDGSSVQMSEILREGDDLERQLRWSDALRHYEASLRQHPHTPVLEQRFQIARLHHDVARRYADTSFEDLLRTNSLPEAIGIYDEVMSMVQVNHVDAPDWSELIECGTNGLEVALSEPSFLARNRIAAPRGDIDMFREVLRRSVAPSLVRTQGDAQHAVVKAANLAEQHLGLSPTAVVFEYLCGAVASLDPYSAYLTPSQRRDVYSQIDGSFVGLGIELEAKSECLRIVRVIGGSPAERAGVLAGDRIMAVDGQSTLTISCDEAAGLLQGEVNSVCRLRLQAANQPARDVLVRREKIDVPSVDHVQILPDSPNVGYLRLSCFQKTTSRDLDAALWRLHRQGMRSLVIDLQKNPGGLLTVAVDVVDKFLDDGVIVSTRGRSAAENFVYSAHEFGTWRVPLVVLIDDESASAAEIFAGAIRDHGRGTIVGVRSFGKGSVQGIFPLSERGDGVRLTTAKFYSPVGRGYSSVGVEPDILVHTVARPISATETIAPADDRVVTAAIEEAGRLTRSR